MTEFTVKKKNINSNRLANVINDFIGEIINNFNIIWDSDSQRDAILEVVDDFLEDLKINGEIEQWNVICDSRNNKKKSEETRLDVYFRQKNCYNISEFNYIIK